ncbi:LEAF RUST 10 DISEASE-RESISTANCE LOCUS RECEPTOR-LIKE PROTEIN KINASE 2.4 [Trifolium repens]|nr:LEAF RUST 10 DISEASE-RESISTANCE LOCUS RECEPTOR-LIKE PROTEIN KINASE 2.4 [Trifolium repens]
MRRILLHAWINIQHTYVLVGDPQFGMLEPQCRVNHVTLTSLWPSPPTYGPQNIKGNLLGNLSYIDIHK